jgi:catechol 2,3-dioxygenase-like lactoylglutathione lyase family enzyme
VTDGMTTRLGPIRGVRLVTACAERLSTFYADAFGFAPAPPRDETPAAAGRLLGLSGTEIRSTPMYLGHQEIEFLSITPQGQPYPQGVGSADTIFQHIALVVPDMDAAVARLVSVGGATQISTDGPEMLPESSGGVTAYKFRDPEGHPLEFLKFAEGRVPDYWAKASGSPCLGFDHSAIAVADTKASLAFYSRLGFHRGPGSLNTGAEQARLDGVLGAVVEVTGLAIAHAPPHVELLCYRGGTARTPTAANDVAATQIAFSVPNSGMLSALVDQLAAYLLSPGIIDLGNGTNAALLRDPDGHRLLLQTVS